MESRHGPALQGQRIRGSSEQHIVKLRDRGVNRALIVIQQGEKAPHKQMIATVHVDFIHLQKELFDFIPQFLALFFRFFVQEDQRVVIGQEIEAEGGVLAGLHDVRADELTRALQDRHEDVGAAADVVVQREHIPHSHWGILVAQNVDNVLLVREIVQVEGDYVIVALFDGNYEFLSDKKTSTFSYHVFRYHATGINSKIGTITSNEWNHTKSKTASLSINQSIDRQIVLVISTTFLYGHSVCLLISFKALSKENYCRKKFSRSSFF